MIFTDKRIRKATEADHKELCRISRTHPAGSGFSHIMFSSPLAYERGWIRLLYGEDTNVKDSKPVILGFTCVRHKVREPKTMLYYIVVDATIRRQGLGQALLDDVFATSPHKCVELSCLKNNTEAMAFYTKNNFIARGESLKGKGWHLERSWE